MNFAARAGAGAEEAAGDTVHRAKSVQLFLGGQIVEDSIKKKHWFKI
jgi:hypothetical protein